MTEEEREEGSGEVGIVGKFQIVIVIIRSITTPNSLQVQVLP